MPMTSLISFPHTHISNTDLNRISAHFDQVIIYQPWHMEAPCPDADDLQHSVIRVEYPQEAMKPNDDFKNLIIEYKQWMAQNRDKGARSFLLAGKESDSEEGSSWEIRRLFSQTIGKRKTGPDLTSSTRWHLTLHLAREFEENRQEAEKLIMDLKNQSSPLKGALEEDPAEHFFDSTPLGKTPVRMDEYHLKQVVEAWTGLFGDLIPDDAMLITRDSAVRDLACELFESEDKLIKAENADECIADKGEKPFPSIILPILETGDNRLKNPVIKMLSGKTMLLMQG